MAERDLLASAAEAFARGAYFEAHELWEAVWRGARAPERRWLGGLIQLAAARHQLARGNARGARRLLDQALAKLDDVPERALGCEPARLAREARALRGELARA